MPLARITLLVALLFAALAALQPAAAQWAWRDASGRMVFSDQPPPKSVAAKDIVRRPLIAPSSSMSAADELAQEPKAEAPAPTPPRTRAPTVTEREIESRRRQQQLAEAEKKAAEEESTRAKRAENCERLRAYLRALEGGFRVARVNASGQQEYLDAPARTAETERTRAEIEQQCQ